MDAIGMAGTLAMTAVVLVWAIWLSRQDGASRMWRALPLAVLPAVATPAVLGGVFGDHALADVSHGILFFFAVVVSVGTLLHAGRAQREPGA